MMIGDKFKRKSNEEDRGVGGGGERREDTRRGKRDAVIIERSADDVRVDDDVD